MIELGREDASEEYLAAHSWVCVKEEKDISIWGGGGGLGTYKTFQSKLSFGNVEVSAVGDWRDLVSCRSCIVPGEESSEARRSPKADLESEIHVSQIFENLCVLFGTGDRLRFLREQMTSMTGGSLSAWSLTIYASHTLLIFGVCTEIGL